MPNDDATGHVPDFQDCYHQAMPGEPRFTLLARDPDFQELVELWATKRQLRIDCGDKAVTDIQRVQDARWIARDGASWRKKHMGAWRSKTNG